MLCYCLISARLRLSFSIFYVSERDGYLCFQYTFAFYILRPKFLYLPIGLHLSSLFSNGNSSALLSSNGRMWSEARSDEMTE